MALGDKFTDIELEDMQSPICNDCIHFNRQSLTPKCKAYPQGIPIQIIRNIVSHKKSFIGDNGIRFKKIEK